MNNISPRSNKVVTPHLTLGIRQVSVIHKNADKNGSNLPFFLIVTVEKGKKHFKKLLSVQLSVIKKNDCIVDV